MMDDYLDDYEMWIEQQMGWQQKIFDDPLANDPFTLLEDSIEGTLVPSPWETSYPPSPIMDELEASVETASISPTSLDPHFNEPDMPEPPLHDERSPLGSYLTEPPPDPTLRGEDRYWRPAPLPKPRLGTPATNPKPYTKPAITSRTPLSRKAADPKTKSAPLWCPLRKGEGVCKDDCKVCRYHNPKDSLHENCELKAEENQKDDEDSEELEEEEDNQLY